MMAVFLRTTSHRSRERLQSALSRKPQYWFTWEHGAVFAEVTEDEFAILGKIKGVTRSRIIPTHRCWD